MKRMRLDLASELFLLHKELARAFDEIAKKDNLHRDQLSLLMHLYRHASQGRPGSVAVRCGDLGTAVGCSGARLSQHLRGLTEAGLCTKEEGRLAVGQGRGSFAYYSLTQAGRALCRRQSPALQAVLKQLTPGAYAFDAQVPEAWMRACRRRLSEHLADPEDDG